MPVTRTATRALRKSERKHVVNNKRKKILNKSVKEVVAKPSAATLSEAFSQIDKAVKNQLIHKNRAARMKSSLSKLGK